MASITINGITLDPEAEARTLHSLLPRPENVEGTNYVLIQADGPLTPEALAELEGKGVKVLEYVTDNSYLCRFEPDSLGDVSAEPFVSWAGPYLTGFKITPALRQERGPRASSVFPPSSRPSPSRVPQQVNIVFHKDVDPSNDELRGRIAAATGLDLDNARTGRGKIQVTVQQGRLEDLARIDEVHHLEPVPARRLFNDVARQIMNVGTVVSGTGTVVSGTQEFQGSGQIVAVADTGFDRGSTTNVHSAFTGRVVKLAPLGRPVANDPDGHGTHVAGSVLGAGLFPGVAPKASLFLQSLLDSNGGLGGIPVDLRDLFEPAYHDQGARIHTNSWGSKIPGLPYDQGSREIDEAVWEHQDLVLCFSAGNSGKDSDANGTVEPGSIGSEAAAKNCITVGASESKRIDFDHSYGEYWPDSFPTAPIASDRQADNPEGMAAFSSRGPTREKRIAPDVVAPGTCILSTRSSLAPQSNDFGTSPDPDYTFLSGTSMATPLVAGAVAVLREALIARGTPDPSAALVKALLINGAVAIAGQYTPSEVGLSPNSNSGFGRVDLANSLASVEPDGVGGGFRAGGPLRQGEEDSFEVDVPEGKSLKVTLVWTDPPGEALQNDLDLIVRAENGRERHGNMGTSDQFDRVNNVEQVAWEDIPSRRVSIIVRAFRTTQFRQPFAVAWSAA